MTPQAERKVPKGKLVRIKTHVRDGLIESVRIEGDFFVHPEEGLGLMESALVGKLADDVDQLKEVLERVVNENELTLIGFSVQDVVELIGGR